MSVYTAMSLSPQSREQPGGVAVGHVPQQPNLGLGPNRYVPPTFNWGRGGLDGRQPQYSQMDWNQMQAYYMPQHQNSPFTSGYMGQLQQMLGQFGGQYGGPNRMPILPQFGSYNPGFGGPTSFYDQMRGGGTQRPPGYFDGPGSIYDNMSPEGRAYMQDMATWGQDRINREAADTVYTGFGGGGFGGRGGYPQMPQFNPYMLARNNMMGMDFNQMFDPRYAMLFGMGGLGAMRPQGFEQGPPSTANGQKPMMTGGGG